MSATRYAIENIREDMWGRLCWDETADGRTVEYRTDRQHCGIWRWMPGYGGYAGDWKQIAGTAQGRKKLARIKARHAEQCAAIAKAEGA